MYEVYKVRIRINNEINRYVTTSIEEINEVMKYLYESLDVRAFITTLKLENKEYWITAATDSKRLIDLVVEDFDLPKPQSKEEYTIEMD